MAIRSLHVKLAGPWPAIWAIATAAAFAGGCAEMPPIPGLSALQPQQPQAVAPPPAPFDGIRKRVAVLRLENKTKTPLPDASWQIGDGLTEMLTTELFKTGRFVLIERAALADVVKEQELGQTGLINKETAAKVGELLGAQMLITGAITEFDANSGGGGGGVNVRGINLALRGNTAHVAVDIRLVDVSTGQILKSHSAEGKASETGIAFLTTRGQTTFGSDAFHKTPLGQAAREAISKAVDFISKEMEEVPWTGRVVQTRGNEIYVNAGANANLRPGYRFAVFSKGEDLRDPATGMLLGSRDTRVGTVTVNHVEDRFSIGQFTGNGVVKRGDLLKPH
ncbi:MAG TPA: CsgG/HfaB family protein [Burkholderiaceae bacterium]|nr:CsgG/HfaB family protein [Burkholderiaceae bacterium]